MKKIRSNPSRIKRLMELSTPQGHRRPNRKRRIRVQVDLPSLLSIDHTCDGCEKGEKCCCSTYEVCVTAAEIRRIIRVLPQAQKYCSHLGTNTGFDNIFEKVEPGLYAIDTNDEGLCLFAFLSGRKIRCSLHAAALDLGLPIEQVKPKACLLWPMTFSEDDEFLSLTDDALSFSCNSPCGRQSHRLSSSLEAAIEMVYGKQFEMDRRKRSR